MDYGLWLYHRVRLSSYSMGYSPISNSRLREGGMAWGLQQILNYDGSLAGSMFPIISVRQHFF